MARRQFPEVAEFPEAVEWAESELSDLLVSIEDYELIDLYQKLNYSPEIWSMDQLDKVIKDYGLTPTEIIESIDTGFSTSDEWFTLNDDDMFCSFSRLDDAPFTIPVYRMVKDILRNMESYGNDDVAEILRQVMEDSY